MLCPVCGNRVPQKYNGITYEKVGRPKTYCSDHCANYMKYFNAMQKELDLIDLDDEHKRKIKGNLFRVANGLKLFNSRSFSTKTQQVNK